MREEDGEPQWRKVEAAMRAVEADAGRPLTGMPYHAYGISMLYLRCRLDPAEVRRALPASLAPDKETTGTFCIYAASGGLDLGPYGCGFVGLSIDGYELPDGDVATYLLCDYRSGRARRAFGQYYAATLEGSARMWREGDREWAELEGPDGPILRLSGRPVGSPGNDLAVFNRYLGNRPAGGLSLISVAGNGRERGIVDPAVEVLSGAPEAMRRLAPREVLWGFFAENMSLTFAAPVAADAPETELAVQERRAELVDLFSWMDRPALIVSRDGRLLRANHQAEALDGKGIGLGTRYLTRGDGNEPLRIAITAAADGSHAGPTIVVRRRDEAPLLVQAFPLTGPMGEPAALVLVTDPGRPGGGDAERLLRLLGLTAAEARLAALVGGGLPPRQAAGRLDITEGTARTTLKSVFRKLAISRQPDLAQLVARLEGG